MINFLDHPSVFKANLRFASEDKRTLYRIANYQFKEATTIRQAKNFITNLINSGVAKIVGVRTFFANILHKITKFIFIYTPIISHLTKFFRAIAFERLLEGMYDSWRRGALDRKNEKPKRDEEQLLSYLAWKVKNKKFAKLTTQVSGSFYQTAPFYEEYLMGYEGQPSSKLKARAISVARRDIGTRTISEVANAALNTINPVKDALIAKKYWGSESKGLGPFISAAVKTFVIGMVFPSLATFLFKYGLTLGVIGLFYYNPREAFFKRGKAWARFKKVLFRTTDMFVDNQDLDSFIPDKNVFVEDAMGDLKQLSKVNPRTFQKD